MRGNVGKSEEKMWGRCDKVCWGVGSLLGSGRSGGMTWGK